MLLPYITPLVAPIIAFVSGGLLLLLPIILDVRFRRVWNKHYVLKRRVENLENSTELKRQTDKLRARIYELETWIDQHERHIQAMFIGLNSIGLKLGTKDGHQTAEFPELIELIKNSRKAVEPMNLSIGGKVENSGFSTVAYSDLTQSVDTKAKDAPAEPKRFENLVIHIERGNEEQRLAAVKRFEEMGYVSHNWNDTHWAWVVREGSCGAVAGCSDGTYIFYIGIPPDGFKPIPLQMPEQPKPEQPSGETIKPGDWVKIDRLSVYSNPDERKNLGKIVKVASIGKYDDYYLVIGLGKFDTCLFYKEQLRRIGPTLPTGREVLEKALMNTKESAGLALPLRGNITKPIVPGERLIDVLRRFRWDKQQFDRIHFKHYEALLSQLPEEQQIVDYWV